MTKTPSFQRFIYKEPMVTPSEDTIWNCRYFWGLREKYNAGEMTDFEVEPYRKIILGDQIVAFIKAPIKEGENRNIHTIEKFSIR